MEDYMVSVEKIIEKQAGVMAEKLNLIKKIRFPEAKVISIANIHGYTLEKLEQDFANLKTNILYQITAKSLPFTHNEIEEEFTELREKYAAKYCISKVNNAALWERELDEYCLYIGSKEKKAIKRFQEHLGIGTDSRSTYALWLKDWWPKNTELVFKIYEFDNTIDTELLQIIEDLLWDEYKPLLGKKGPTGKKKN
jgi:hypothetical protein